MPELRDTLPRRAPTRPRRPGRGRPRGRGRPPTKLRHRHVSSAGEVIGDRRPDDTTADDGIVHIGRWSLCGQRSAGRRTGRGQIRQLSSREVFERRRSVPAASEASSDEQHLASLGETPADNLRLPRSGSLRSQTVCRGSRNWPRPSSPPEAWIGSPSALGQCPRVSEHHREPTGDDPRFPQ